jgi:hypothetical protein
VDVVLGKAAEPAAAPRPGDVAAFAGTYEGPGRGSRLTLTFVVDSGYLAQRAGNATPARLRYAGNDTFNRGREIITFMRDSAGKIVSVRVDRVFQNTVLVKRP